MSDSSKRGDSDNTDYVVGPTIVGGRPVGNGRPQRGVPRGIEVLVKKASVDPAFREILLEKRAAAATEIGLELSAAEIAVLNSLPRPQVEQIIQNTTVPDEHRRVFLGKMATAMLALIGLSVSGLGCATEGLEERKYSRRAPGGISPHVSTNLQGPLPYKAIRVRPDHERLQVGIVGQLKNAVMVKVNYDCPFESGEVTVLCGRDRNATEAQLITQPERIPVLKGTGEATFSIMGKGGTSRGLLVRLLNTTEQCDKESRDQMTPGVTAIPSFRPGEYVVRMTYNRAFFKIVEFRTVWFPEE
jgi:hypothetical protein